MIFDNLDKYTTESVLQGHPDKICDQISDALLDAFLMQDCNAHTAIECLGSGNNLIVAGKLVLKIKGLILRKLSMMYINP